jgi:peroxiredoxin
MNSAFASKLIGTPTPAVTLSATSGVIELRELCADRAILFVYPATGVPGRDPAVDPAPGWDHIPGAPGCTAQCLGFAAARAALNDLGIRVAGVSSQSLSEQQDFALRHGLEFPLICDAELKLARTLSIPTFTAGNRTFYKRLVLHFEENTIVSVLDDLPLPGDSAKLMLALMSRPVVAG